MDTVLLKEELGRYEGRRNVVYKDSVGLATVGVGHLCLPRDNLAVGDTVDDATIDRWLDADIIRSTQIARTLVSSYDRLDDCRQRIVVNLCFNLGNRFGQFVNTIAYINAMDFDNAATNLSQSKWYAQVGHRGVEMCDALRRGVYTFR